ncbi:MAG TPA: histidinol-phosphatase [Clostridiales bacterium UBA8153]|nr:histidinol-phosphatase [Clostridiales bacterium UBA8153]
MRWYAADLHLHSALSPCALREMTPAAMARALAASGVHLAAITDHNSCENAAAFVTACRKEGITPLVGMELETREEVHLLCLFSSVEAGTDWQGHVYGRLPWREDRARAFGTQWRYDAGGRPMAPLERLLTISSELGLEEACAEVKARGGLCIPAHIDRPAYSLLAMLGLVPRDLPVPALEISARAREDELRLRLGKGLGGRQLVSFSDAHCLDDIWPGRTALWLAHPSWSELELALAGRDGRRVVVLPAVER